MTNLKGIDYYSSVNNNSLREIANDNVNFICRYYYTNTSSSNLVPSEPIKITKKRMLQI
jgi:hypothetical protein